MPRLTPRPVWHRLYADFLMPSRLGAYRQLLEAALVAGYSIVSIERFWTLVQAGTVDPAARYLVLRHDVDTDPASAGEMLSIEHSLGAEGSYFFRLSTVDLSLMARMAASNAQVGYHYEELAAVAKARRVHLPADAQRLIPEAQDRFVQNLDRLRGKSGLAMRVVASHGDFVNRSLGLPNWAILVDPAVRRRANVDLETYDETFMAHVSSRHSDTHYPRYWIPGSPAVAIAAGEPVIYLLVHPRHWRVARVINLRDDAGRVFEGLSYRRPAPAVHAGGQR